jgi:hypothetical protein
LWILLVADLEGGVVGVRRRLRGGTGLRTQGELGGAVSRETAAGSFGVGGLQNSLSRDRRGSHGGARGGR